MRISRWVAVVLAAAIACTGAPLAAAPPNEEGVKVGNPSIVRRLVSAETVEKAGEAQFLQLTQQASSKRALLPEDHPQVSRLRRIFEDLLPHSYKFNERAKEWRWQVNAINSRVINASCLPGGKVVFFTGILDKLQLTDDEAAMIMGHEIAHALREHARERLAKQRLTSFGVLAVNILVGGNAGELARVSGGLLGLKFSRDNEIEADLIGMELAARAGYDPRAGISLWHKMSAAAKGAPLQWLSTHPSNERRIETISNNLKDVLPLYERARVARGG